MQSRQREELARLLIGFALSVAIVPSLLLWLGAQPLTVAAVGAALSMAVAAWGFPAWRILSYPGLALLSLAAFLIVKYEEVYTLPFEVCTSEGYDLMPDNSLRLKVINVGIRLINNTGHDLWIRTDEESFGLGNKSDARPFSPRPRLLPKGNTSAVVTSALTYDPAIPLAEVPAGRIRYVLHYGRSKSNLMHSLVYSGDVSLIFLQNEETVIGLDPDEDSQAPIDKRCRLPSPVLPRRS